MATTREDLDRIWESCLADIEQRLMDMAAARSDLMNQASQHIIKAGGKRFRPGLVVLASQLSGDAPRERIVDAAVVVELTHVASLYHDDVMDEASVRRSAPSANARWSNSMAILVGDYLFARASAVVAQLGPDYVALQADTFARLVTGQINETTGPADGVDAFEHYLAVLADKTGSLIAASTVFGGMVAGLPAEQLEALGQFGEEIGLVFQLSDDLLDVTSDVSGKSPGTDLREGVLTLPTLLALEDESEANARLRELISGPVSEEDLPEALRLLRQHGAIDAARESIAARAEKARAHLASLPAGAARDALSEMCDSVVSRSV